MAVFAAEGVVCTNVYAGAHGVSRKSPLRIKIPRLRKQYNRTVNDFNQHNRMHQRLNSIVSSTHLSPNKSKCFAIVGTSRRLSINYVVNESVRWKSECRIL